MSHLWIAGADAPNWTEFPLAHPTYLLGGERPRAIDLDDTPYIGGALLIHTPRIRSGWLLLADRFTRARVNGAEVLGGLRALQDRDEIRVPRLGTCYFSTESLARVQEFPKDARRSFCPRCKLALEAGVPAVRCPAGDCGVWHHQSEELPCWTYAGTCSLCPQPTSLDAGYRWTPWEAGA
jgi:hypothetical protein